MRSDFSFWFFLVYTKLLFCEAFAPPILQRAARCQQFAAEDDNIFSAPPTAAQGNNGEDAEEEEVSDEELEKNMGEWDERVAQFNSIHLTGRIGSDPEPRYLDDGKVVVNLSLANKQKYHSMERKVDNIAWGEEETCWYGLEIWGQTAEWVAKYVDKGSRVGVVGSLHIDTWTDKESGEPRTRPKIVVREIDLLETRAESELRRSRQQGGSASFYGGDNGRVQQAGSGDFFEPF